MLFRCIKHKPRTENEQLGDDFSNYIERIICINHVYRVVAKTARYMVGGATAFDIKSESDSPRERCGAPPLLF